MNKNEKLGNPVVGSAVASYVAQNPQGAKKAVNIGLVVLGVSLVAVGGFAFYSLYWKHRFKKFKFDTFSQPSNVSASVAEAKAQALYEAMHGAGTNETAIYNAFRGVNKNGFIAIYNAFGKREPQSANPLGYLNYSKYLTLTEYLRDDLNDSELEKLKNIAPYLKNYL